MIELIPYSDRYVSYLDKCIPARYVKRYMNRGMYRVLSLLKVYHSDFYLYMVEEEIVGCILIRTKRDNNMCKTFWIYSVLIFPEYRGKGYSKDLMRLAIDRIPSSSIFLYVNKENEVAINLYHQIGFREEDDRDNEFLMRYVKV